VTNTATLSTTRLYQTAISLSTWAPSRSEGRPLEPAAVVVASTDGVAE